MSCNIEVELGGLKVRSDRVVYFSCSLFLVLQILVAHGFVDFSNTGIVSVPEKPDLQSSEPVAPRLVFVHKKELASSGKKIGASFPIRSQRGPFESFRPVWRILR